MVRDQAEEEKDAYGNQQNPYDLVFQFFFNGILDHYFPSLSSWEISLKFSEIVSLTFLIKDSLSFRE